MPQEKQVPCLEGCHTPMGLVSRLNFTWIIKAFCISLWVNHQIRFALARLFDYTNKQEVLIKAKRSIFQFHILFISFNFLQFLFICLIFNSTLCMLRYPIIFPSIFLFLCPIKPPHFDDFVNIIWISLNGSW